MRVDLGREAVDVDDLLVGLGVDPDRVELLQLVPDREDDVGVVETEVHVVVPHETQRPDAVVMVVRHDPLAVEGVGHRDAELLGEPHQGVGGVGTGRTVPGQHHRPLRLAQDVDRAGHLTKGRRLGANDVARQRVQFVLGIVGIDVLGHCQIHRRGSLTLGELERFADHLRDGSRGRNVGSPPGDRREHRHQVDVLVRLLVLAVLAHLSGDRDQRRAVGRGVGDAQLHVDRTGSQRGRYHRRPTGDPPVHLGHERRRLLVPGEHVPDAGRRQRPHEADVLFTRQPEDHLDALVLQALDYQLGSFAHLAPPVWER